MNTTIPDSPANALEMLDAVAQRTVQLRNALRDGIAPDGKSLDGAATLAVYAAAMAASNLSSLGEAIRQGKLPRRKRE